MLHYAAVFGFGGIAAVALEIAKTLIFIFAIMTIVNFVISRRKKNRHNCACSGVCRLVTRPLLLPPFFLYPLFAAIRNSFSPSTHQGFDMNTDTTSKTARQTSDPLLNTAEKAVDTTRSYANDALDKAEAKMRELRGSVDPVVDMLASKAQKLARQSLDIASEAKNRAQQSLSNAAGATTRYVEEKPLRSVLIAAAVGASVALLISSARHHKKDRY